MQRAVALVLSIAIILSPFSPLASAASFTDTTNADFAQGENENTENVDDTVRLTAGKTQGRFTSRAFDTLLMTGWNSLTWTENEPIIFNQENDNAGAEPITLADGSENLGVVAGGYIGDTRQLGGYESIGENTYENRLNWEHRIENVATGYDNYTIKIKGYTSGDSEKVGVYIWNVGLNPDNWTFIDNLTTVEKTITKVILRDNIGDNIENYLVAGKISIKYFENNVDTAQTIVYVDLCIVEENITYDSEVRLQARTSYDNLSWTSWRGPNGTPNTYFTNGPGTGYSTLAVSMENIPDNRYIQYRVYLTNENSDLSGAAGPRIYEVTIDYTSISPTLTSPANGSFTNDSTPTLDWADVEGAVEYRLYVDNDANFTSLEINAITATSQYTPGSTLADENYYWKVRAKDGAGNTSLWSSTWTFTIDTITPPAPSVVSPENNSSLVDDQPTFSWTASGESGVSYRLQIDNDNNFSSPIYHKIGLSTTTYEIDNKISENFSPYYWRVASADNAGNENWSAWYKFSLKVPPNSYVGPISPYWENSQVRVITATATDNDGVIENVELWYHYRENSGVAWGGWIWYENDASAPYSWSFDFSVSGNGLYEFYTRAMDNRGNRENAPLDADAASGYDSVIPAKPTLLSPENMENVQTTNPTFYWTSVNDNSGVTYNLVIDNDNIYSAPYIYYKTGILENYHTTENLIEIGVYYWHVRAIDNAKNYGSWTDNFVFRIRIWFSVENWAGTVTATSAWQSVESWSGIVEAQHGFKHVEIWTGAVIAAVSWRNVETWSGTVAAPLAYGWRAVESWNGAVGTVVLGWRAVETWSGTVTTSIIWTAVEIWTGTVSALPTVGWKGVEMWGGSVATTTSWRAVETWTGIVKPQIPAPVLLSPVNGTNTENTAPTFDWDITQAADNFQLQVDNDADFSSPVIDVVVTTSYYSPGAGLQDNLYRWRVKQFRSGDNSAWSTEWTVRIDTIDPAIPTPVWPTIGENVNDNTPFLRWQAPPENSYPLLYYVEISPNKFDITENAWVQADNWTVENSLSEGVWYWRATARDNAGNTGLPFTWRDFRVDTVAPAAPTLLSPANNGWKNSYPNLDWTSVAENSLPVLYNLVIKYYPSLLLERDVWTTSDNYLVTLDEGTYQWRVKARDNAGNESSWSENRLLRVDNVPPSQVQLLYPENSANLALGTIPFKWENATDGTGSGVVRYQIQIDNEPSFTDSLVYENENVTENTYNYTFSTIGYYYWRVRAIDNVGNPGVWADNYWFVIWNWSSVETWIGTVNAPAAAWRAVDTWVGVVNGATSWRVVESWGGILNTSGSWKYVESWTGTLVTSAGYEIVETWTGVALAAVQWRGMETWSGAVNAAVQWRGMETWSGNVASTTSWRAVESWTATMTTIASWRSVESWSGAVATSLSWRSVESWSGTLVTSLYWRPVETWTGIVKPQIPAPVLLSPVNGTNTENTAPTFDWDITQAADNFQLQVDNDADFSSPVIDVVVTTSYYSPGAGLQDNLYRWRVKQFRSGDNSAWSTEWTVRIDTIDPAIPTPVWPTIGENVNDNTPFLRWQAPPENSYPLLYYVEISPNKFDITENAWVQADNWTVENSLSEGVWYWRATARDNAGNTGLPFTWRDFRVDTVAPAAPTLLSPANNGWKNSYPNLDWTSVAENSLPVLYNLVIKYYPSLLLERDVWTTSDNYLVTLDEGTYQWRVKARDNAGNESSWSENRLLRVDNVPPSQVQLLYPENSANLALGTIPFKWENATDGTGSGVVRYQIQIDNEPSFTDSLVYENENVTENTYNYTFSTIGYYYWRVRAIDNAQNEGSWQQGYWLQIWKWSAVESWVLTVNAAPAAGWSVVDNWRGTVNGAASWRFVERWTGSVGTTTIGWREVESWTATIGVTKRWNVLENWAATVSAPIPKPVLLSPGNGTTSTDNTPTFDWDYTQVTDNFRIQIDNNPEFSSPENDTTVFVSQYTPSWLPDNLYYWRVIAWRGGENSGWSENWTVRIDTLAPAAPTLSSPENGVWVTTMPNLDWNTVYENSTPITYYAVVSDNAAFPYENHSSNWTTLDNWVTPPLSENVVYYWRVRAKDFLDQAGNWSENWWFMVDNTPPTKVLLLNPENNLYLPVGGATTFTWENATDTKSGVVKYWIQIDDDPSFSGGLVHENDNITENTYSRTLSVGTYYWRVRAVDNVGNTGLWADNFRLTITTWRSVESWSGTVAAPIPAPILLSPPNSINTDNNTPTFDWDNTQKADDFRFQLDNDENFTSTLIDVVIVQSNYTPAPLGDNLYYWRARMTRSGQIGSWSQTWTIRVDTLDPNAPTLLSPDNGVWTTATPTLDWASVTENSLPVNYYAAISDNRAFLYENENSGWISADNWVVTPALTGGTWYWRVKARDNAGNESSWSENRIILADNTPPTKVSLLSPENNSELPEGTIQFMWDDATDVGSGISRYWIQIDNEADFTAPLEYENPNLTNNNCYRTLAAGTYYWRVRAVDNVGNTGLWSDNFRLWLMKWRAVESWSGTVSAPMMVGWSSVELWTAIATTIPAVWRELETWQGAVVGYANWRALDSWTGTVVGYAYWRQLERWTSGIVNAPAISGWKHVENWTGRVYAPHGWMLLEKWHSMRVESPVIQVKIIVGLTPNLTAWYSLENWGASVTARPSLPGTVGELGKMSPGATATADFSIYTSHVQSVSITINPNTQ
ncbi:MAG: Ig-like domain-containing protein, partial [Candidatus Hadarchaeota archaeon]